MNLYIKCLTYVWMSVYDQWSQDSCCEEIFGGEGICSFHQHHHRHHHRLCLIDFKYFKIAPTHIVELYWLNRILVWVRVLHDFKMAWVLPREFEVVRSTFGWLVGGRLISASTLQQYTATSTFSTTSKTTNFSTKS